MSDQNGRETPDPLDVTRLAAFLGDVKAQEVVRAGDFNPCCCAMSPCRDDCWEPKQLGVWLTALSRLLAKLPPHRLLVNSTRPLVYALDRRVDSGLVETKTNWPHDTPAERWLMADAALACAGECSRIEDEKARSAGIDPAWIPEMHRTRRAIAAGRAWVEEPTPLPGDPAESLSVCEGIPEWAAGLLIHTGHVTGDEVLLDAARVLGEPRVREIVTAALFGRLL